MSVLYDEMRPSRWIPEELLWLFREIRPLLAWHAGSFLCITAGSLLALCTPLALKWLIDRILPERNTGLLLLAVALIFLAYQGRTVLTSLGNLLMLSAAQKMSLTLRVNLLRHLDTLSADYYDNTAVGTAMYPFKEPIDEVSYFGSDLLPAILRLLLTTSFTLGTMFLLSPVLTLSVVPLMPVFLITRQHFRKQLANAADTVQRDRLAWNGFLEEHLSSAIPIQLLGQERRQERRAFRLLGRSLRSQQRLFIKGICFAIWSSLAVALAVCAVVGYGGLSVLRGTLSLGSMVAFYGFVTQLFDPLSGAAELYARTQKTLASVRQVQSVFALRPQVVNHPNASFLVHNHRPEIEFTAVKFSYARQKSLLHILALRILAGEHVAMAGENGAGKSTIGKLLVRLYDPTQGSIRLGGKDLRNIRLDSLRSRVCYLPREPVLFDGTLASNLRIVRPTAGENDLGDAIANVGLSSFVANLPHGLHQRIGPGGCQLSGGERQRIAIARALLQRPRVLILDEATSCLDPQGETLLLENIRRILGTATLLVVSHRLSTFCSFHRVLILSSGQIVNDGGPDVLARERARYGAGTSFAPDLREINL